VLVGFGAVIGAAAVAAAFALFGGSDDAPPTRSAAGSPAGMRVDRFDSGRAWAELVRQVELGPRPAGSRRSRRLAQRLRRALPHGGFERPSHCAFGPDDALYVTDFGEIDIAPEKAGIRVQAESGTLWRIRRDASEPAGDRPPAPVRVPFYAAQYAGWLGALVGIVGGIALVVRRLRRRRRSD